ncbi:MAG: TIM barrel protein [Thermoguttaceae bacterium]|jgi:sugar phosphate isomerase/epimerase
MSGQDRATGREFLATAIGSGAAAAAAPALLAGMAAGQPARGGPWQIGCYTRPWAELDYRAALDDIAAAGFKYAGLMSAKGRTGLVISPETSIEAARQIGDEARQRGLGILSVWGGQVPIDRSIEAAGAGLRHLVEACAAAGAKSLLLVSVDDRRFYQPFFQAVAECCDYAARQGVGLTIKPHGSLVATGPELRKCVELVGKKNFSIFYDAGNILFYSDGKVNPVDDAAAVAGLVTGWCIKDFSDKPQKDVALEPGTGKVDFRGVLARLKQGGFVAGPLIVETLAPGDRPRLIEEAKKARRFLEDLLA